MDKISATCPECGFRVASNARRTEWVDRGVQLAPEEAEDE